MLLVSGNDDPSKRPQQHLNVINAAKNNGVKKIVYTSVIGEIGELGEFMGTIIAGIYQGIRDGEFYKPSDYHLAAGREHITWADYFKSQKGVQR